MTAGDDNDIVSLMTISWFIFHTDRLSLHSDANEFLSESSYFV